MSKNPGGSGRGRGGSLPPGADTPTHQQSVFSPPARGTTTASVAAAARATYSGQQPQQAPRRPTSRPSARANSPSSRSSAGHATPRGGSVAMQSPLPPSSRESSENPYNDEEEWGGDSDSGPRAVDLFLVGGGDAMEFDARAVCRALISISHWIDEQQLLFLEPPPVNTCKQRPPSLHRPTQRQR